jgi:hypothetical protein
MVGLKGATLTRRSGVGTVRDTHMDYLTYFRRPA